MDLWGLWIEAALSTSQVLNWHLAPTTWMLKRLCHTVIAVWGPLLPYAHHPCRRQMRGAASRHGSILTFLQACCRSCFNHRWHMGCSYRMLIRMQQMHDPRKLRWLLIRNGSIWQHDQSSAATVMGELRALCLLTTAATCHMMWQLDIYHSVETTIKAKHGCFRACYRPCAQCGLLTLRRRHWPWAARWQRVAGGPHTIVSS